MASMLQPSQRWLLAALAVAFLVARPAAAEEPKAASAQAFPPELVNFTAYGSNPIFKGAGPGHWDVKIRERGWILKEGDLYRMWYTGFDGTREGIKQLGYATSRDGIHWERWPNNPIDRDHWVEDMMVLKHNGTYYMFAEGTGDEAQLLTSPDGINWKREGRLDVRQTNGQPISPGPYGTPFVLVEDGTWYLFYERGDLGVWLATSRDRKVWTNVQDDPVIKLGPGEYDRVMIALNQIIKHKGRYYALLHGSGDEQRPRLWSTTVAVSDDLIHWTKYPGNPLFPVDQNKSSGVWVHDGEGFRLYTMHDEVNLHLPRR